MEERRAFKRAQTDLNVIVSIDNNNWYSAKIANISPAGCELIIDHCIKADKNDIVYIKNIMEELKEEVLPANIRWIGIKGDKTYCGVKFEWQNRNEKLFDYIKSLSS